MPPCAATLVAQTYDSLSRMGCALDNNGGGSSDTEETSLTALVTRGQ